MGEAAASTNTAKTSKPHLGNQPRIWWNLLANEWEKSEFLSADPFTHLFEEFLLLNFSVFFFFFCRKTKGQKEQEEKQFLMQLISQDEILLITDNLYLYPFAVKSRDKPQLKFVNETKTN